MATLAHPQLLRKRFGHRTAGALRPLAVLRQQMPLLRLQQPCPGKHRPGPVARRAACRPRPRSPPLAGPQPDLDLFRGRHALADGPRDRRALSSARRASTGEQTTASRSRSKPTPILSRRRASPISPLPGSIACRSACKASTTTPSPSSGRAHSASEGLRRPGYRPAALRPGQFRPDLRPPRRRRGVVGRDARPRARHSAPTHLSLYQLTIEPGTRFAALEAAGKLEPRSTPTSPPRSTN